MNPGLFQTLADRWDAGLTNATGAVIAASINAIGTGPLATTLMLFVMVYGFSMMNGTMAWNDGVRRLLRIGFLLALITMHYQDWVVQPILHDIPDFIAQSIGGSIGTQNGSGMFDDLARQIVRQQAAVLQEASGLLDIAERALAYIIGWGCLGVLLITFFCFELARAVLSLLVTIGPWVALAYMFDWSRGMAFALAGQVVTYLLIFLLLLVVITITINLDRYFAEVIANTQGGQGLSVGLNALANTFWALCFGLGMVILIPSLAAAIGGGAAASFAPFVHGGVRGARTVAAGAGRAAALAARRVARR